MKRKLCGTAGLAEGDVVFRKAPFGEFVVAQWLFILFLWNATMPLKQIQDFAKCEPLGESSQANSDTKVHPQCIAVYSHLRSLF